MQEPYFVMLTHPSGEYFLPLTDENGEIEQFETQPDAMAGALSSSLGSEVGFEIFDFRKGL